MADQLEQIKQKYSSVFNIMQQLGVQLHNVNMAGTKLYVKATAPSEDAKNKIWDQIKLVDQSYSDLTADINVSPQAQTQSAGAAAAGSPQVQTYTVKPGDTLTAISLHFYGKANDYQKILDANPEIESADKIRAGQTIKVPA